MTRIAIVKGARNGKWEVEAYLPSNYEVILWTSDGIYIAGKDNRGWTLDDYVIPRLSSGNMACRELVEAPF